MLQLQPMQLHMSLMPSDSSKDDHQARSEFVRKLVQNPKMTFDRANRFSAGTARTIVQFWDDLGRLPKDVQECIDSWSTLAEQGIRLLLFDDHGARNFIAQRLGPRYENAYQRCYHPAMRSDYFRLCYILLEGGCYVDVDDVHHGPSIEYLFEDGRLKLQPLCYDVATDSMISPSVFMKSNANMSTWIFYFNNNPLVADRCHPVVKRALANATEALERPTSTEMPEIQSTTGPGNLTKAIFELASEHADTALGLVVLHDWESVATSKWPLSYRADARNWRLSNRQEYWPRARGNT